MTQHNREPHEDWLETLDKEGKSLNTLSAYRRAIAHFLHWHDRVYEGSPFDVGSILPRDIRDWKAQQQRVEKAAPASINQRLVALNRFFEWAQQRQLCRTNPVQEIAALRLARTKPQALKPPVLRRLLRAAQAEIRDYAMLEVLVGTGLRVHELLDLKLGDIELSERSGKLIVRHSKGGQYREVPLTLDCRQALQAYLEGQHPQVDEPACPLWFGKKGPLRHRSSVMRMVQKYGKRVGIEHLHPHQLRHTFASRYLTANPDDLRGLARLLGHANLNTVMIYTEPNMEDLAERMERMELGDAQAR
jgi:site-specific recombinase XerD